MNKPINLFQTTGSVAYKAYYASEKRLVLGLNVSIPKMFQTRGERTEYVKDYPRFTITGDEAEEINSRIERGTRITITGHLETVTRMHYEGHSMYRQTYDLTPVVDNVYYDAGSMNGNAVLLAGEVTRVYRNPDPGKQFYMITISAPVDGQEARLTFMYFDKRMQLEPQVGDYIIMSGVLQTRFVEAAQTNRARRTRNTRITQMSIVSRTIAISRKNADIRGAQDIVKQEIDPTEAHDELQDNIDYDHDIVSNEEDGYENIELENVPMEEDQEVKPVIDNIDDVLDSL